MSHLGLQEDTIAALITPPGEGGVAVIRLSGPQAFKIADKVFKAKNGQRTVSFASHTIHFGEIYSTHPASPEAQGGGADAMAPVNGGEVNSTVPVNEGGINLEAPATAGGINAEFPPPEAGEARWWNVLDQALLSIFRAPHSYTGEDVIEFGLHGGMVLASKVLALILSEGARFAEPGEFTRRAFLNRKIDLTQAEAVLDLIKSKSGLSIQTAVRQLGGALSTRFKTLKNGLMKLYAHMEAFLDFPDEDLEIYSDGDMARGLRSAREEILGLIQSFQRGALLREGALLVIAGRPNVGKSSLFNALLERDRALVSEFAGTTRDTLEEWLEVNGLAVRLADTAGLMQKAQNPLDAMGVERARRSLQEAHAYLFLLDGTQPLQEEDFLAWKSLEPGRPVLGVLNKSDLGICLSAKDLESMPASMGWLELSSKNRSGFETIEEKIFEALVGKNAEAGGEQITRVRHKRALEMALEALVRSEKAFESRASLELVALDLKIAIDALRELIGEVYSEDLLDVIFAEFCIGK